MKPKGKRIAVVAGVVVVGVFFAFIVSNWEEIRLWYLLKDDFESLGRNAHGFPEYRHRQTGIVMVRIPGGTFWMGSPKAERGHSENEEPFHEVTLSPFFLAKYEVIQSVWAKESESNPSQLNEASLPVDRLTWNDRYNYAGFRPAFYPCHEAQSHNRRPGSSALLTPPLDARTRDPQHLVSAALGRGRRWVGLLARVAATFLIAAETE